MSISQFDSLSSDYDSLIDECFHQYCEDNNLQYWSDAPGDDYPDEFKLYFIQNNL